MPGALLVHPPAAPSYRSVSYGRLSGKREDRRPVRGPPGQASRPVGPPLNGDGESRRWGFRKFLTLVTFTPHLWAFPRASEVSNWVLCKLTRYRGEARGSIKQSGGFNPEPCTGAAGWLWLVGAGRMGFQFCSPEN